MSSRVLNCLKRVHCVGSVLQQTRPTGRLMSSNIDFFKRTLTTQHGNFPFKNEKSKTINPSIINCQSASNNSTGASNDASNKCSDELLEMIYLNLQESLPKMFVTTLDYSIYDPNLVLVNNIKGKTTVGLAHFVKLVSFMRIFGHFRFAYVKFDILSITKHKEESTIHVRWQINGIGTFETIKAMFQKKKALPYGETLKEIVKPWMDAYSIFHVNEKGIISKVIIDRVITDSDTLEAEDKNRKVLSRISAIPKSVLFLGLTNDITPILIS